MNDSLKAFDKVEADLNEIVEKGNFLPNCSTKQGYEASKEYVLKVTTPARTALISAHKEAKAFYLEGGRFVDSKKNELMDALTESQKPHQEAYKAVDDERKRIKAEQETAIQNGFDYLKGFIERAINQDSETISFLLDECAVFDADPSIYRKEIEQVVILHQKVMSQLTDALTQSLQIEDMKRQQEEIAKKQREIDAKEKEQEEARLRQERAEHEAIQRQAMRLEAEEAAQAEVSRLKKEAEDSEIRRVAQEEQAKKFAEDAIIEAQEQARIAAEDARIEEVNRQAQEQLELMLKAEAREADKKHRGSINSQAMNCLVQGGLSKIEAKLAIRLIASNKVAHIQISY